MSKYKSIFSICCLFILLTGGIQGASSKDFYYQRPVESPITEEWHTIDVPPSFFRNLNKQQTDFRLLGVKGNDTIEVPFLMQKMEEESKVVKVKSEVINQVYNKRGAFLTFEITKPTKINYFYTEFKNDQLDWKVKLEGSNNQKEWFTITEDRRFLKINESYQSFNHTELRFPTVKYRYLRLHITESKEQPILKSASIQERQVKEGVWDEFLITDLKREEDKKKKLTNVYFSTPEEVLVSRIILEIDNAQDYYRMAKIGYTSEELVNQDGKPLYPEFAKQTISSLTDDIVFDSREVLGKGFKLQIVNWDNEALDAIKSVKLKCVKRKLVARFSPKYKGYQYGLYYGMKDTYENRKAPKYDIKYFKENIPDDVKLLTLGDEKQIRKVKEEVTPEPLITNSIWLWILMGLIIFVLGGFTLMMVKNA